MRHGQGGGDASIIDVARLAGVSPSTASRSLRGMPHVSEQTRRRVQAAADELAYVASPAGAGLASGRTRTVGVVVPLFSRWFFAQVVAGAAAVLREAGYDLLLEDLGDAAGRERFFARLPLRRRVDAVLVVSLPLDRAEAAALRSMRVPVVTVGARLDELPGVRIDDEEATLAAIRHLQNLGHSSIAMISALEDDDLGFTTAQHRRTGFRRAVGTPVGRGLEVSGRWGIEGGAQAMSALLSSEDLPTAVFAEYDEMAFGALLTLRRAGLHVPRDISVVGFDDHEMARVADLTTVAQPVREQGRVAAHLLLDALADRLEEPTDVVLPTRLVVRGTTGPPAARRTRPGQRRDERAG